MGFLQMGMVFMQGVLSFFSPCVLPLVPLYVGYLAGGGEQLTGKNAKAARKKLLLNTLFFILGIGFAFFLLCFAFTSVGRFFQGGKRVFEWIAGILIVLLGLYQLGVFKFSFLQRERRLPFSLDALAMNPLVALVMGFTFSFAWTPCVGPALAAVLMMAGAADTASFGYMLILVYTLGFVLPFLGVGVFTQKLLAFLQRHKNAMKYTAKVGGALLLVIGVMTLTGWMGSVSGYLARFGAAPAATGSDSVSVVDDTPLEVDEGLPEAAPATEEKPMAPELRLVDQYGQEHALSEYRGKVVFLNFWATWCPPCRAEMPDIEALYADWEENSGDVVVLGVANPSGEGGGLDEPQDVVEAFLGEGGYTYPTLMDLDGSAFEAYYVSAIPVTAVINRAGEVSAWATGMLTREQMDDMIAQALEEG